MKSLTGLRQGRAKPGVITSVPPRFIYGLLPPKSWWWSAARPHISPGVNKSSPPTVPGRSCGVKIDKSSFHSKKRWPKLLRGVYKLWTQSMCNNIRGNEHASMEKTCRVLTEKRHTGIIVDNLVAQEIRAWWNLGVALRLLFPIASPSFHGGRCYVNRGTISFLLLCLFLPKRDWQLKPSRGAPAGAQCRGSTAHSIWLWITSPP